MGNEKTKAELLKEELCYDPKHVSKIVDDSEIEKADNFAKGYIDFLNVAKTEREVTAFMKAEAEAHGFTEFDKTKKYAAGDKVYSVNRDKCIILCVFGKKDISEGVKIAAAHVDAPRMDLKPNPLYEAEEMAFFKTHYYGGIKKYQWTAIPLSLHGVLIKANGEKVTVNIGEGDDEPKFVVTDLLPHLGAEQMKRTLAEGIKGEELNILIGSRPFKDDKASELVKLNILKLLNEKYGIIEGVSDRDYVSNSFHCHVAEDITPIQKQDLEYRFWELCNGGKIQYVKYPIDYNIGAIKTLIRRAMDFGFYEGVNMSLAYCDDCGHQELEMDVCPKCGSSNLTKIDRMNGYLSYSRVHGDTRLNDAKMAEIKERKSM